MFLFSAGINTNGMDMEIGVLAESYSEAEEKIRNKYGIVFIHVIKVETKRKIYNIIGVN